MAKQKNTSKKAAQRGHAYEFTAKRLNPDDLAPQEKIVYDALRRRAPAGLRFVAANETEGGGALAEAFIKQLTGSDTLVARRLYEESFNFVPQAKFWLRTNHKPEIRGDDQGIWRRIVLIPFTHSVAKQDKKLLDKLKSEAEGILNWMLAGWLDYLEHGLVLAEEIQAHVKQYQQEQDVIGRFLEEMCVKDAKAKTPKETLYRTYSGWAEANKFRPKDSRAFHEEMLKRKFVERREGTGKRERVWQGVGLRTKY
jgi:putative DNA primase/helicase